MTKNEIEKDIKKGIYREKLVSVIDDFKKRINEGEKKEIVIPLRDIRKILGEGFETYDDKSDSGVYSRTRGILLEFGIKTKLYHHYGANLVLTLAEESEIKTDTERSREIVEKTAHNAGFINVGEYQKNKPSHRRKLKVGLMDENIDCPLYLGSYIKNKYIKDIFPDAIPNPSPLGYGDHNRWDWICKNGIKIKVLNSCLRIKNDGKGYEGKTFQWNINENDETDIFVLNGFKDRESLGLMKTWVFDRYEIINDREFWDRYSFTISINPRSIEKYSRYEINNERISMMIERLMKRERTYNISDSSVIVNDEDILTLPIDFKNKEKK